MTLRVVVADDHPIFRDGLVKSLEETGEFRVVGVATTADEAIQLADQKRPDLALLDLSMPGGGLSAVRAIAQAGSAGQIAMLTVSEEDENVSDALQYGAMGYILTGVSAGELRRILKAIAAGEAHVSPALAAKVLQLRAKSPPSRDGAATGIEELTKRETDILKLVAQGMSNKQIAGELDLQEKTVKHYMTAIMGKLHAKNRVEAAIIAHEAWRGEDQR